jgi:hypothetical protein
MSSQYYKDNMPELLGKLQRAGIALQEAGAEAMTMGAKIIAVRYKKALREKTKLRNEKFTLGSVVVLPARAYRSDKKTLRRMDDVNAITGVKQLRGGTHYLAAMEIGGRKKGAKAAGNRVAVPLKAAREGDDKKPIAARFRLSKGVNQYQRQLATPNVRQQYALLYGLAKRGLKPGMYQSPDAIFHVTRKKVSIVRTADRESIQVKPAPLFEGAVKELTEAEIDKLWVIGARKKLAGLDAKS